MLHKAPRFCLQQYILVLAGGVSEKIKSLHYAVVKRTSTVYNKYAREKNNYSS